MTVNPTEYLVPASVKYPAKVDAKDLPAFSPSSTLVLTRADAADTISQMQQRLRACGS